MKLLKTNTAFIFIRILLCAAIICLFALGIGPRIIDLPIRAAVIIAFAAAMCMFTAVTIARYIKEMITIPLNKMLESAQMLAEASVSMSSVAKGIGRNADIMVQFADLLDGMSTTCNVTIKDGKSITQIEQSTATDDSESKDK